MNASSSDDLLLSDIVHFTFEWNIENISVLVVKGLFSQNFSVPAMEHSEWYLRLVPAADMKSGMCYLSRTNNGPNKLGVYYSLSVGSSCSTEFENFIKNAACTKPCVINLEEFVRKVDQGYVKDVMTIKCRFWQYQIPQSYSSGPTFCSNRTLILLEEKNELLPLTDLIYHGTPLSATMSSKYNIECSFRKLHYSNLGLKIGWKLKQVGDVPEHVVIKCKFHLVDALEERHVLQDCIRFKLSDDSEEGTLFVPGWVLEKKDLYSPDTVIFLFVEFSVSNNDSACFVESDDSHLLKVESDDSHLLKVESDNFHLLEVESGWRSYLDRKYNENPCLFRFVALLIVIVSVVPHLFKYDNSL